jgi:hypothetical protein
MTMALSAKNKLQFVDGSLPHSSTLNGPEFRAWKRCNDTISSWIVNTVSKDIATSILYINNCQDVWKERFSQKNGPQAFQLQKSKSSLSQDNMSVSSYFTHLKSLCDEFSTYKSFFSMLLCSCLFLWQSEICSNTFLSLICVSTFNGAQ